MKNQSYLNERIYIKNLSEEKGDETIRAEWKKLLGQEVYEKISNSNEKFNSFLNREKYMNSLELNYDDFWRFLNTFENEKNVLDKNNYEGIYFLEFYKSSIEYGKKLLEKQIDKQFLTEDFLKEYEIQLLTRLQEICVRCLITKMHEAKNVKYETKNDKKDMYDFFCEEIVGTREFVTQMFVQYPVMMRCVLETIKKLGDYYKEICENFKNDKDEIENKLCKRKEVHKIKKIILSASDVHNNGKQVAKVCLDNGEDILYKARSMENEYVYNELLQWLAKETGINQKDYTFIFYKDHSWTSIVKHKTCVSKTEIDRYYIRLGVQLFLVYVLGTKDLHYENLIASGEYPVIIDLENLSNIRENYIRDTVKEEIFYQLLQSVLYTGILPFYAWNKAGAGINSSAISGKKGQKYPFKIPVIIDGGTERMRVEYRYPVSQKKDNLATLEDVFEDPILYKDRMLEGFKNAYQSVLAKREQFRKKIRILENVKCRYLLADTQRYSMLLAGSYHPSLLVDGAMREIFLYSMWKGRENKEIVACEVKELLNGDIPYFYFKMNSNDLVNMRGKVLEKYFYKKPIDIICEKLRMLNENDMERQCEYINWVMDASSNKVENYINRVYSVNEFVNQSKIEFQEQNKIIRELTEKVLNHAIWNEKHTEVSWCTFQFAANGKTWDIKPMNWYMYDGLAGMLLLLFELKSIEEKAIELYETVKEMLFKYTDKLYHDWKLAKNNRIGAYDGESSIVYSYLILNKKGEKDYLEYAIKHAKVIEKIVDYDAKYDLLAGNAGAAYIMLMLYERTNELGYLHIAERAIIKLEENSQKQVKGIGWEVEKGILPMAGIAHGNSGILMPVLRLWEITKKEKYKILANEIWKYEDSLYDSEHKNWKDMREKQDEGNDKGAMAWCHGAPGILLSRVICYRFISDEMWKKRLYRDIEKAYAISKQNWVRDSWSICHGNIGNYGILLLVSLAMDNFDAINKNIFDYNVKLLQQEKLNPGLFNGYSGVLYAFLKKIDISDVFF